MTKYKFKTHIYTVYTTTVHMCSKVRMHFSTNLNMKTLIMEQPCRFGYKHNNAPGHASDHQTYDIYHAIVAQTHTVTTSTYYSHKDINLQTAVVGMHRLSRPYNGEKS